jgi:hypothetical protein
MSIIDHHSWNCFEMETRRRPVGHALVPGVSGKILRSPGHQYAAEAH